MKAERAARSPAMRSSSDVLPEPEGPKTAVTCRCISTSTSSVKSASDSEMFFNSRLMSFFAAQEKFAAPHGGEGKDDRYSQQAVGVRVLADLHVFENGERECRGLAWNIAGDHDRGAKFAECAGE